MKLTQNERVALLNQYRILNKLDPDSGWDEFVDILQSGYAGQYDRITEFLGKEMSDEDCKFVEDVLNMYDMFQLPYQGSGKPVPQDYRFPGFDGNNEGAMMGYARFLRKNGRWTNLEVGSRDLNSHMRSVSMYRRMLDKYIAIGEPVGMSGPQAAEVIAARSHPSNRP